jgi:hypothetical protein
VSSSQRLPCVSRELSDSSIQQAAAAVGEQQQHLQPAQQQQDVFHELHEQVDDVEFAQPKQLVEQVQHQHFLVNFMEQRQQDSAQDDLQCPDDFNQEQQQMPELASDTSFVPASTSAASGSEAAGASGLAAGQQHDRELAVLQATQQQLVFSHTIHALPAAGAQAAAAESATQMAAASGAAAAGSPSKPTYSELQLRCQLLESALEQQQQSSEAALAATLAGALQSNKAELICKMGDSGQDPTRGKGVAEWSLSIACGLSNAQLIDM